MRFDKQFKNGSWLICPDESRKFYNDYVYVVDFAYTDGLGIPRWNCVYFNQDEHSVEWMDAGLFAIPWTTYNNPSERDLHAVVSRVFGKKK
jgi:hypothetical protein